MVKQRTINQPCSVEGVGLHTGCSVNVKFLPAPVDTGIQFIRVDCPDKPVIQADLAHVLRQDALPRCTSIGKGNVAIHVVEHLMGVLCGLNITNLFVEIDAQEIPALDGGGTSFLKLLKEAGLKDQAADAHVYAVQEPVGVSRNGASLFVTPAEDFKVSYMLDYAHPLMKSQFVELTVDGETVETQIAPCRTFCLEEETQELLSSGLGQGASYKNALIVGQDGVKENQLLFPDEFARHKILDLIGDLYLLGMPIRGHVFAMKSGHTLNVELLKSLHKQREKYSDRTSTEEGNYADKKELDIEQIMQLIPHRYPFLLVDRVIEIEAGQKAVGIKNVTINENFFQGHFPSKPVMPGVLMVEAMAQTAGVLLMSQGTLRGKLALFMAINNAKFRKMVGPGDQLFMEVSVLKQKTKIAQMRGVTRVKGDIAVEADMTFTYIDI